MKLNKLVLPLALALVATLASTTGCKHGFNGDITKLPGHRSPAIAENNNPGNTLPPGGELPGGQTPGGLLPGNDQPIPGTGRNTQIGGGELSTNWDPALMNQDREKLAGSTVHFKFDSAVVQDSEQSNVANVGQALSTDPTAKLLIEGHCDERGTEEYNRALGERRALALREALARIGVDPLRIRTISYGKDQPVDPGHNEAAWAKNRRGQFIWCTPKGPVQ
jgi:peptidoglycan-associated lipoprotein